MSLIPRFMLRISVPRLPTNLFAAIVVCAMQVHTVL